MVEGCHALGYEYIAITDHSSGAAASRTLARDDIARQREEIDALRERFPGMTILHGIEVDILPDGRLDFEDDVLERFDIVLASLHEHARQDAEQLTQRSIAALRHPLVNVLCHPANQLVGRFEGYPLDFDALYAAAAETGTALEIDGAPSHLDLDGERARAAAAAGVTLTIDSDCHRAPALGRQMRFGVGTARRGWVEPRQVLNTRPLAEVREFIAAKRRGRPALTPRLGRVVTWPVMRPADAEVNVIVRISQCSRGPTSARARAPTSAVAEASADRRSLGEGWCARSGRRRSSRCPL